MLKMSCAVVEIRSTIGVIRVIRFISTLEGLKTKRVRSSGKFLWKMLTEWHSLTSGRVVS